LEVSPLVPISFFFHQVPEPYSIVTPLRKLFHINRWVSFLILFLSLNLPRSPQTLTSLIVFLRNVAVKGRPQLHFPCVPHPRQFCDTSPKDVIF
jgi:hypothetical protein